MLVGLSVLQKVCVAVFPGRCHSEVELSEGLNFLPVFVPAAFVLDALSKKIGPDLAFVVRGNPKAITNQLIYIC